MGMFLFCVCLVLRVSGVVYLGVELLGCKMGMYCNSIRNCQKGKLSMKVISGLKKC